MPGLRICTHFSFVVILVKMYTHNALSPLICRLVPFSDILLSLLTGIFPAVRTRWPFFQIKTMGPRFWTSQGRRRVSPTFGWEKV